MKNVQSRFYLIITIVLLLVMVIGFTPSFYGRWYFDQPPRLDMDYLPWKYVVHGCAMTLWFMLLVVQSALVTKRQLKTHQSLGYASMSIAVLVIVTSLVIMFESTPRLLRDGILDPENKQAMQSQASGILYSLFAIIIFTICIAVAFSKRKYAVIHRSFMLYGSLAMLIPATNRITFFTSKLPSTVGTLIIIFLVLGIPASIFINDWVVRKRFPIWAAIGFGLYFILIVLTTITPQTEWGYQFFLNYLSGLY